ncbi:helix-turn-helix transcriptional regulator [Tsukamurella pseudospumae]|uniref:Helix-turn-helix domain-containing protein n=1 Tax=Tsukamurella pseudospumae TaxID=239498 RepID=A0A138A8K0_9ACTN|nr:hypothetical protein [Tsukamurella pseudospumae]KXP06720.1 hypothetical protein AXK60_11695 [Tsukamurella pseudospumae]
MAVRAQGAVSLTQAASALGISVATASRAVRDGTFPVPTIRMGARVIVPTPKLRELLQLTASEVA